MPFLHAEHALLGARRACSQTQLITTWFLVGYALYLRWHYPLTLRIIGSVICKGFYVTSWDKCKVMGDCFLTLGSFFSHRAHRVNRAFLRTFRAHRTPSAYREHRGLSTKISCNVLWYRLTQCLCEMLCVLFFCVLLWEKKGHHWEIEY